MWIFDLTFCFLPMQKFGIHLKEIDKEEHLYILVCTRDSSARLLGK